MATDEGSSAPGPPWTKEAFERMAKVEVSDEDWEFLERMAARVKVGDVEWKLLVKTAKALEEKAKVIQEQQNKIQQMEADRVESEKEEKTQYLVLGPSAVSKDFILRKKFRFHQVADEPCRGGFIAQKFYLEFVLAAGEFKGKTLGNKSEVVKAVRGLGNVLKESYRVDHSLFNSGYLDEEAPQSAVGSELLQLAIDMLQLRSQSEHQGATAPENSILRVTHQQHLVTDLKTNDGSQPFKIIRKEQKKRDSTGEARASSKEEKKAVDQIDICAWFVHKDSALGACVLAACEYKPSNTDQKEREAQADMYGSNILILHQKPCIVIDIAGADDLEQWVVSARGLVPAEFSEKEHVWEKTPLYSGKGPEAIVLVAYGLLEAKKSFPQALKDYGSRLGPVVGTIDDSVYKVYDNDKTRKPNIEVVQNIFDENAELLSSADGKIDIIKMKLVKSDWKQEGLSWFCFRDIIGKLRSLHNLHGPHGDIRLANLLSSGEVLDFDFVGAEYYPTTLQPLTLDGKRHPDVEGFIRKATETTPNELLKPKPIHDWYSLGHVMRLFAPTAASNEEHWNNLCVQIENGRVGKTIEGHHYTIRLKNQNIPLPATGNTRVRKQPDLRKQGNTHIKRQRLSKSANAI